MKILKQTMGANGGLTVSKKSIFLPSNGKIITVMDSNDLIKNTVLNTTNDDESQIR